MDANSIKIFQKWVKTCKKLNLSYAKMGDFEYTILQKEVKAPKLGKKSKNDEKVEGLIHDPSAAMPSDGDMLYYSTDNFDLIRESRKDPTPR